MSEEQIQTLLAVLSDTIKKLKNDVSLKDYEIQYLKSENARLNELLTPTKQVGEN